MHEASPGLIRDVPVTGGNVNLRELVLDVAELVCRGSGRGGDATGKR